MPASNTGGVHGEETHAWRMTATRCQTLFLGQKIILALTSWRAWAICAGVSCLVFSQNRCRKQSLSAIGRIRKRRLSVAQSKERGRDGRDQSVRTAEFPPSPDPGGAKNRNLRRKGSRISNLRDPSSRATWWDFKPQVRVVERPRQSDRDRGRVVGGPQK